MRNEESILASSWTWILGSSSSVVLSACNYYKTCYKWGEDASSYVAAGKVSIVYPFQGIQSVFTLITTDHRCEISHGIDYLTSYIPDFELFLVCAVKIRFFCWLRRALCFTLPKKYCLGISYLHSTTESDSTLKFIGTYLLDFVIICPFPKQLQA